ncbi:HesB/IscA family protein [Cerasicoccus fimbriatus]|uniref:HesB/IscA family protein n=1 Tax=Cerasicoccus fimbriatus TaxID=3014554 RepID=UPI0022B41AFD|nr:iron-sulfur cluster assembly accessory protein [Cerasicoccus sp. TK19100]
MSDSATLNPPADIRIGDERLIQLTESAGKKASALIAREQKGEYLRVAINGGGCNGLSYKMKFVAAPKKSDILVPTSGVHVVVDMKSALYLKGTIMDYSDKLVGGGFKFTNPNAKSSCSCGESFSV